MIRGIYTAGSGMMAESIRNDVTANNLANANTVGYKKDVTVVKDFRSMLLNRINDGSGQANIGSIGVGAIVDTIAPDQSAGSMRFTGNNLDVAIEGKGFFTVDTPNGVRYTRNGAFSLNSQGDLVTRDGYRVLGTGGPINLADAKKITISEDGRVMTSNDTQGAAGYNEAGTLQIVTFADEKQLSKEGANLFQASPGAQTDQSTALVREGTLEQSNVNVVSEMVNMIAGYRAFEIDAKMVQSHDELLDKAVNDVGKV
ncbi:MAG: flagellar basal-body rod protein FlgF [Negativicutes bacterium]|nr:flagellar basal-body rod protein FlgF [Negativicutes bacterium]MDR3592631.1 flagellar basal-body rod protein FlgF [Negativicutes bacterium]